MRTCKVFILIFVSYFSCNESSRSYSSDSRLELTTRSYDYIKEKELDREQPFDELNDNINEEVNIAFDGEYCADVSYFNPKTGTSSEYRLIVEVEDDELVKINFPQGWLDDDQFNFIEFNEFGFLEFETEDGHQYSVQILEKELSDCFKDVIQPVQCNGITKSGRRCLHLTDNLNGFCFQHQYQINNILEVKSLDETVTSKESNATNLTDSSFFTIGTNLAIVKKLQGTPDKITKYESLKAEHWYWRRSEVVFKNGVVNEYTNDNGFLKIKLVPKTNSVNKYFEIGSDLNLVLSLQGTPDKITKYESLKAEHWYWRRSEVVFKNGVVNEYTNDNGFLNIK